MDHGVLNIPLSKRGDIDAQLDAYKREAFAQEKRASMLKAAQRKADKAQAKQLLAKHEAAILARHGEKFGVKALRETLDQWAKWEPAKLIAFVNKFLSESV